LFTLIKAQKEEKEDAIVKVLQFLRDSPFIGGFQVEVVYADKSKERKGGGCYGKSSTDLMKLFLYWQISSRDCLR
jgi:hypothetical protein